MGINSRQHDQLRETDSTTSNTVSKSGSNPDRVRDLRSHVQRAVGNQGAQRILQRNAAEPDAPGGQSMGFTPPAEGAAVSSRTHPEQDGPTRDEGEGNLPDRIRSKMEGAFGADFSDVEVTRNSRTAAQLNAIAYTRGEDIHFAPGYNPYTSRGQEPLGHELAHVVQQRRGDVETTHRELGYKISSDSHLEREADAAASKAASGQQVGLARPGNRTRQPASSPLQLQRQSIPSDALILDVNTSTETVLDKLIETAHAASPQAETVNWRGMFYPVLETQIRGKTLASISHTFTDDEGLNADWEVSISFFMRNVRTTGRQGQRSVTTSQGGSASPSLGSSQTRTQTSGMTVGGEADVKGGSVSGEASLGEEVSRGQSQTAGGGVSGSQSQSSTEAIVRRRANLHAHIEAEASVSYSNWDIVNPFKWGMHAGEAMAGPLRATSDPNIGTIIYDDPQF